MDDTTKERTDRSGPDTIVMYGADWCGDCRRSKKWFADNGVNYEYVNLEATPDAADVVLARNNGLKRIPVIVFPDDTHLTEPSDEALAAKVSAFGLGPQGLEGAGPADPGFEVVEDKAAGRFDLRRDGEVVGFASYRERGETVVVPHVETMPQHRGQGYAGRLMEGLLAQLRDSDRTIAPLCPFAAQHLRDNPQHHDLVAGRDG